MFTIDSALPKIFARHINAGTFKLKDVPALDNLKNIVLKILESGD